MVSPPTPPPPAHPPSARRAAAAWDEALAFFASPRVRGLYVVGYRHPLISFYSQQMRALNFVWALCDSGRAHAGERMVVVGAGISGVTAGVAAAIRGLSVTIVDHAPTWIGNLRFASHRYMHPRMAYWPERDWEDPVADLPVLGWHAMYADRLWHWFDAQLEHYARAMGDERLELRKGAEVERIRRAGTRGWEVALVGGNPILAQHVLLALGPGHEPRQYASRRYWDADAVALDRHTSIRAVRVSGTGDGGLIDAIRLSLFDSGASSPVTHRSILELLYKLDERASIDASIAADRDVLASFGAAGALSRRKAGLACRRIRYARAIDGIARVLEDAYLPTMVTGHGTNTVSLQCLSGERALRTPLAAAPLHQALAVALAREGRLRVEQGGLALYTWDKDRWTSSHAPPPAREVHELVIRHGAEAPLCRFLQEIVEPGGAGRAKTALWLRAQRSSPERRVRQAFPPRYFAHPSQPSPRWDRSEWPASLADLWLATRAWITTHARAELRLAPPKGDERIDVARCVARPDHLSWLWPRLGDRLRAEAVEVVRTERVLRGALGHLLAWAAHQRAGAGRTLQGAAALAAIARAEAEGSLARYHDRVALPVPPAFAFDGEPLRAEPPLPPRVSAAPPLAYRMVAMLFEAGPPALSTRGGAPGLRFAIPRARPVEAASVEHRGGRWIVEGVEVSGEAPIVVTDVVALWPGPADSVAGSTTSAAAARVLWTTLPRPVSWGRRLGADRIVHLDVASARTAARGAVALHLFRDAAGHPLALV